jgi:hypothetical protein
MIDLLPGLFTIFIEKKFSQEILYNPRSPEE